MSLKFEKVDDILTENGRDNMTDKFTVDIDFVKSSVMELIDIARKPRTSESDSIKCFDIIATINEQLDDMWEVYADLGYAYSILLEKYQEVTKKTE